MKQVLFLIVVSFMFTLTSCWFVAGVVVGAANSKEYTPVEGDQIFQITKKDTMEYFLIKKNCPEDTLRVIALSVKYAED